MEGYLLWLAEEERLKTQAISDRRFLREWADPLTLPEETFIKDFRIDKQLFSEFCNNIIPYLRTRHRITGVRPEIRILAAINFYATGSYQKPVGRHSTLNLSQAAVSMCLEEVTEVLNKPEILSRYIKFPTTIQGRQIVMRRFMELYNFPGILGCIDGTHVAIIRPHTHEEAYFNRKQYHSLNVLIICDADLQILHVDASFGGASHDSHVWNQCPVRRHLEYLYEQGERCWLLADSGYAQRPWLMTPVLGAAPGTPEDYYTQSHCTVRNSVERCIGVLKARWRCLLAHRVLHYDPIKAGKIVNACIVLHNIANQARLPVPELSEEDLRMDSDNQIHILNEEMPIGRSMIITRLWRSRHLV